MAWRDEPGSGTQAQAQQLLCPEPPGSLLPRGLWHQQASVSRTYFLFTLSFGLIRSRLGFLRDEMLQGRLFIKTLGPACRSSLGRLLKARGSCFLRFFELNLISVLFLTLRTLASFPSL